MSWVADLRSYIVDSEIADGWEVFAGDLPDTPARAIGLIPYAGIAAHGRDDCRVQLIVRGKADEYDETLSMAEAIRLRLLDLSAQQIGGTDVRWCNPVGTPNHLGRDSKQRPKFSVNLEIAMSRLRAA